MFSSSESAEGQQRAWILIEKLGEGDAGEVFRVASMIDGRSAVLKRPRRSAFPSDLIRQAAQIEKEARILKTLALLNTTSRMVQTPAVLDQSKPGAEYSERFFIVISPAPGINLSSLYRFFHFDLNHHATDPAISALLANEQAFLKAMHKPGQIPDLLLLRMITGVIEFLEAIHTIQANSSTEPSSGVIWNDIKLDHFYWDPTQNRFTLIDWGNAQYIEADGITKDRQYSRMEDYLQFVNAVGKFLNDAAPGLMGKLDWPNGLTSATIYTRGILPIKERASELLTEEELKIKQIRRKEADILRASNPKIKGAAALAQVQEQIISSGEMPDIQNTEAYISRLIQNTLGSKDIEQFRSLSNAIQHLPILDFSRYRLLEDILSKDENGEHLFSALFAGLDGDWSSAFWAVRLDSLKEPGSTWWEDLFFEIHASETGQNPVRPFVALNRLIHALKANKLTSEEAEADNLLQKLSGAVLPRWSELEPDPPDSGIDYIEIETLIDAVNVQYPEATQELVQALDQPRAQVRIALDAWNRQDFLSARRALKQVLMWDPDRLRLITADNALKIASGWTDEVRVGLIRDEPLQDFITRMELRGRELRNQVGPAGWLDDLLEAFKKLRNGMEPTDVLVQHNLAREMLGWLISLEPRRPLLASPDKVLRLERMDATSGAKPTLYGTKEDALGQARGLQLSDSLDTWTPEARGSSARLFEGTLLNQDGSKLQAAIKVMRPDKMEYALPLFREEARILSTLSDVPGVARLIETGYLKIDHTQLPSEDQKASASTMKGQVIRYGVDVIHNFIADLETRLNQDYLPYLAIDLFDQADNLLVSCDTGFTHGRFLPTLEGLVMAIQICDILEAAHSRNIIYRDHKILHYYWKEHANGIFMIDWNIAKRFPEGLSESEVQFDLVQFGARALHYILTGRSAQGALPLGPNKPEEIEAAARSYTASWTYDDQRLPKDIKDILEAVLAGEYKNVRRLREDLMLIYEKLLALVNPAGG